MPSDCVMDKGRVRLNFGKHAGEFLDEVNDGYLKWLVRTFADGKSHFSEKFIIEVEQELKSRGIEMSEVV